MFTQLSTWLKLELVVPVQIHMTVILYVYKIWRLLFMSYELTWERDGRIATITAYVGTTLHRKLMNKLSQVDSSSALTTPLSMSLPSAFGLTPAYHFWEIFYYCIVCVRTINTYRVYWLDSSIPAQMLWSKIRKIDQAALAALQFLLDKIPCYIFYDE